MLDLAVILLLIALGGTGPFYTGYRRRLLRRRSARSWHHFRRAERGRARAWRLLFGQAYRLRLTDRRRGEKLEAIPSLSGGARFATEA